MTICDIVNQFTHLNFNLIVRDLVTNEEYYNGSATAVCYDPVGDFPVVAMEPPRKAGEVILYIDIDEIIDVDYAEYAVEDI